MKINRGLVFLGSLAVVFLMCGTSTAEESAGPNELMLIDWQQMQEQGHLKGNEIAPDEGERLHPLKIVSPLKEAGNGLPAMVPILELPAPKISKQVFMLSGWVRYENVQGTGFLEMWSLFPDGSHYFTRTLAGTGPMGLMAGTSDWRPIQLPFQMSPGSNAPRPNKLILNAGFQGPGSIWLSGLKVIESDQLVIASQPGSWWNDRAAAWIGTIGGTLLGVLGGLIGFFSQKKLMPGVTRNLKVAMASIGGVTLFAGLIAFVLRQPYGVYYPLLMLGLIATICGTILLKRHQTEQAEIELRQMEAMDIEG
ncbi:MAG: hypothetical protein KDA68_21620 [Planctomycetaceae bacterium]|nr:hypothetical protein [Planctomycetaceae bacterium]